jgi:glutaredoxin
MEIPMTGITKDSEPVQQQCTVRSLYFSGAVYVIGYVVGLIFFAVMRNWIAWLLWLVFIPLLKWVYLRFFPLISKWRGYGRIADRASPDVEKTSVEVTFYSLLGCPFCPIVERRLRRLQNDMGFSLTAVDLTLKPGLAISNGILSVPVVEAGKERLVGNATSEELAQLIACAQTAGRPQVARQL